MSIPFRISTALLSADHILGDMPATDKASISIPGPSVDEVVWQSRLDIGFSSVFETIALQTNFKARSDSAADSEGAYAGTCADDASIGTKVWTSVTNAQGSNPAILANSAVTTSGDQSHYLKATNFGLSIPSTATIVGVEVIAGVGGTGAYDVLLDNSVKLVKGGTIQGNNNADGRFWSESPDAPPSHDETYGSSSDMWGVSLTPADVNASTFGCALSCTVNGTYSAAHISRVQIIVYYYYTATLKFQIKPDGQDWEDIPDTTQTVQLLGSYSEYPIVLYKTADDFTNNNLPADIRLVCTSTSGVDFEIFTLYNSAFIVGNSIPGVLTNYPFDWTQYILGATHIAGSASETFVKEVDNPSSEIILLGYVDPGFTGTINTLEVNSNITGSVDAGTQATNIQWQVKPVGETIWHDIIDKDVTLTTTPTLFGNYHDDLTAADIENMLLNPGLETGDYTDWTAQNAGVIDAVTVHSGSYSQKLTATGSTQNGGTTKITKIDPAKIYTCSMWFNVTAYTSGDHTLFIQFFNGPLLGDLITTSTGTVTVTTPGWMQTSFTVGPAGSGANVIYPANTTHISLINQLGGTTPTATVYSDDYKITGWGQNLVVNPGFETGDFTGWIGSASIESTIVHAGTYSAKTVAAGSPIFGPVGAQSIKFNPSRIYDFEVWYQIPTYSAGVWEFFVQYFDHDDILFTSASIKQDSAVVSSWTKLSFTFGPIGSGADFEFPDGAFGLRFGTNWITAPTGTAYIDDFVFKLSDASFKGPFEYKIMFSATGTGKIFTFTTDDDSNNCRLIGTVD